MIKELKDLTLKLRKERDPLVPSLSFVNAQIDRIGKDDGNRATTEDEAIKFVQKLLATLKENLKFNNTIEARREIELLESLLPAMVSEEEVRAFILGLEGGLGEVMKAVRAKYGSLVDMKLAKSIVDAR